MPPPDRLRSRKNAVSRKIAGLSSRTRERARRSDSGGADAAAPAFEHSSPSAASGPIRPAAINAARQPHDAATMMASGGAMAPPRKPEKGWIENARPIRRWSIACARVAAALRGAASGAVRRSAGSVVMARRGGSLAAAMAYSRTNAEEGGPMIRSLLTLGKALIASLVIAAGCGPAAAATEAVDLAL